MPLDTLEAQRRASRPSGPICWCWSSPSSGPPSSRAAQAAGVLAVVVNATMSPRSFARHHAQPSRRQPTIVKARRIYAQDETIAARYAQLGARERIEVLGNLKLVPLNSAGPVRKDAPPLIVFGNVHRDEIEALAPAIAEAAHQTSRGKAGAGAALSRQGPRRGAERQLRRRTGHRRQCEAAIAGAGGLVWLDEMGTLGRFTLAPPSGSLRYLLRRSAVTTSASPCIWVPPASMVRISSARSRCTKRCRPSAVRYRSVRRSSRGRCWICSTTRRAADR